MNFWFCETCGKRLTDKDIEEGKARDKKLRGVFCSSCAAGVNTMEMYAVTPQQIEEAVKKKWINPADLPDTPSAPEILPPAQTRKKSSARNRAISGASIQQHKRNDQSRTALIAGVVAAAVVVGVVISLMLRPANSETAIAPTPKPLVKPASPSVTTPVTPATAATPAPKESPAPPPAAQPTATPPVVPAEPEKSPAPVEKPAQPAEKTAPLPASAAKPMSVDSIMDMNVKKHPPVEEEDEPPAVTPALAKPPKSTLKTEVAALDNTKEAPVVQATPVVAPPPGKEQTLTLVQGVDNYNGCVDAAISSSGQGAYNNFNGVSQSGATMHANEPLWCWKEGGAEFEMLIKFTQIPLTARNKILSARLELVGGNYKSECAMVGGYLAVDWTPNVKDPKAFGWVYRTPNAKWSNATGGAAGGAEGDILKGKTIKSDVVKYGGDLHVTIDLDPAIVSKWIQDPATNFGVLLRVDPAGRLQFSPTGGEAGLRPKLVIKYQ